MLLEHQPHHPWEMLSMKVHGNVLLQVLDEREQVSLFKFKVRIQFDGNRRIFREQSTKSWKRDGRVDNGSKE